MSSFKRHSTRRPPPVTPTAHITAVSPFSYMSCTSLKYFSVTPDFFMQYHNCSLGTLSYDISQSTKTLYNSFWPSVDFSINSFKATSAVLFLRMKPCCCSQITSLFNLTSETFSHSYITFLISFIPLYLLQICTWPLFLQTGTSTLLHSQGIFSPCNIV